MKDTLKFIGASGLAAPQVMVSKRVIVYRVNKNRIPLGSKFSPKPWTYMINPEITPITKKKKMFWERCLSLPGLHAKVPRYDKIFVKYYTPDNKLVEHEAHSTWAALIQHEYDHLQGILFTDKLSYKTRKKLKEELNLISVGDIEVKYKMNFFNKLD